MNKKVIAYTFLCLLFLSGCTQPFPTFEESVKKLPNSDIESLQILDGIKAGYAKDKNQVYHFLNGKGKFNVRIVKGADLETFHPIKTDDLGPGHYAKDRFSIFYFQRKIEMADNESFVPLKWGFSKDKDHVFLGNKVFDEADLNTFKVIDNRTAEDRNNIYKFSSGSLELNEVIKKIE
jgi:hypothetical protein